MKHFNREELLRSLKRIQNRLESLNELGYFLDIINLLDINKEDINNTEFYYTDNIIEDIFVIWYESGICKDFSTEIDFLIKVDKMLDILDIQRIEFNAYITKQENIIPKKD